MCQSYGLQNTEGVIFYQYASPNGLENSKSPLGLAYW
jgi:hypothetical protein